MFIGSRDASRLAAVGMSMSSGNGAGHCARAPATANGRGWRVSAVADAVVRTAKCSQRPRDSCAHRRGSRGPPAYPSTVEAGPPGSGPQQEARGRIEPDFGDAST